MKKIGLLLVVIFAFAACKKESTISTEEFYSETEVTAIMKEHGFSLKLQHSGTSEKGINKTLISKKQMNDLLSKLNNRDKIEISGTARVSAPISGTTTSNLARTNDDHSLPEKPTSIEETSY